VESEKSFIAALLAQYLQEKGVAVRCLDADPVNCLSALGNVSPVFQARFGRKI
jgi:CO dehydrogenase nickel-insertion accessory protein CooC1